LVPEGEATAAPPPPPVGFYGRPLYPVAGAPVVAVPASTTVIVDHQRGSSNFGDVAVGMAAGAVMGAALSNLGGSSALPVFLLYKMPAASWRCFFLLFFFLLLRPCLIELATGHGGRYVGGGWGVQDNDVIINNYNINEYVGGGDWQDVSTDFDYSGADFGGDF
jgi:hypothetical protein